MAKSPVAMETREFEAAVDNYLELTALLIADVQEMLDRYDGSQHSQRTFVRGMASLFEGHAYCLHEVSYCAFKLCNPSADLACKERKVLEYPESFGVNERLKFTLRAAYRIFDLDPQPDFGSAGWEEVQTFLDKRDRLMHPKTRQDLEITDPAWNSIWAGSYWLMQEMVAFEQRLRGAYLR